MTSSSAPPPPEERPDPDGRRWTASTASGRGWFRRLAGSRVVRRAHALLTASSRPDRHRPGAREAGGEETELEALFGPDLYTFSGSPQGSPDTSTTFDPAPPPRPIEQALGPSGRALRAEGRLIGLPHDPALALEGLTPEPLPAPILAGCAAVLSLLEGNLR